MSFKNRLEAAGIKAYLSAEEAVAMAWQHVTGALGTELKFEVASKDRGGCFVFVGTKTVAK